MTSIIAFFCAQHEVVCFFLCRAADSGNVEALTVLAVAYLYTQGGKSLLWLLLF